MRATASAPENNKVTLTVEIDDTEIAAAIDATAKELAQQINVKGFRQGKAPRSLIEQRLGGPAALRAEALNSAMPDFYAKAISETLIDPISQPKVDVTAGELEGPVTFSIEVEVRPEITLSGYQNLKVQIPSPLAGDDEDDRGDFGQAISYNVSVSFVLGRGPKCGKHILQVIVRKLS